MEKFSHWEELEKKEKKKAEKGQKKYAPFEVHWKNNSFIQRRKKSRLSRIILKIKIVKNILSIFIFMRCFR